MVQIPEETKEKTEAFKAGYKTIAEISKERIRRAGKKIKEELREKRTAEQMDIVQGSDKERVDPEALDIGFRVLKIASSNRKNVYVHPDEIEQGTLDISVSNIKEGRTAEDLLFQVLIDWGIDLTLPIHREKWRLENDVWMAVETEDDKDAYQVYFVGTDTIAACFDENISEELAKEIAKRKPLRMVFQDAGFKDDATKINVEQIFKLSSPNTEIKTL